MTDAKKPWDQQYGGAPTGGAEPWKQDYGPDAANAPAAPRGLKGWGQDIAATAVKGAIAVPEALVGLADIPTGGRVGKFLENEDGAVGFRPKQAKEAVNEWHSDATKEAQRKFQAADGIVDKAAVAIQNPSLIATAVGESLPSMGLGGVAARGLMAATKLGQMGAKGAVLAGAAGEGATMAGSQAEQIRQETKDGLLTPEQSGLALATGVAGSAFGVAGGKVAQRLGIGDADTLMAQGIKGMDEQFAGNAARAAANPLVADAVVKSIPRKVIEGAIAEGFLEELPQSMAEQIFQNIALGKPWSEELDSAAVMGVLSGGAMGAGAGGFHGFRDPGAKAGQPAPGTPDAPAGTPAAPDAPVPGPGMQRVANEFAARLQALQEQEQGEAAVPQTAPPDGAAALAQQQAQAQAARDAEIAASRAIESPDDEILASTGAAMRPSEAMGLRPGPAAGTMENAAAMAVDTGAHGQMQEAAALAQAAEAAAKQSKVEAKKDAKQGAFEPGQQWVSKSGGSYTIESVSAGGQMGLADFGNGDKAHVHFDAESANGWTLKANQKQEQPAKATQAVDPDTGEISGMPSMADWSDADLSNAFRHAQALDVRRQLAGELSRRAARDEAELQAELQADQAANDMPDAPDSAFTRVQEDAGAVPKNIEIQGDQQQAPAQAPAPGSQAEGANVATLAQLNRKKLAEMSGDELQQLSSLLPADHSRQQKIQKAIQTSAQQAQPAINQGAKTDGTQTPQAQQSGAQPAQTEAAQASAPAAKGVIPSATPTQHNGAQAQVTSATKSQAQSAQAAPAKSVGEAESIAKEGNAQREQERQRKLDASERWTRMTTVERQAVTATAAGLNPIARKNLHTRAWADIGEKTREKLLNSLSKPDESLVGKAQAAIESEAKAAPQVVSGDAPVKPAAQPVGDEKPFAAETGTLGIPRADMPQVPTASHGGMVKHLNAQGIAHETTMVDASELKPTQAEYSPSKVEASKTAGGDRAVIVSSDGHIIDGHHQAVAAAEEGKQVRAIVLDAPVEQALAAVKASPSANVEAAAAPATATAPELVPTAPKSVPQRMKEAKEAKSAAAPAQPAKPKSIPAKVREAMAARADYFTPGNIIKSYGGHDRVITYTQPDAGGSWSVKVQAVRKDGSAWVDEPNEGQRTHATQPTARDLKAGPVERAASEKQDGALFRRQADDSAAGADFDVASFRKIMDEGQSVSAGAVPVRSLKVRPSYSPEARAEAVRAVSGTADAIRKAWANGPEVIVAFDMQDPVVPESARRADLKQRSGGAQGAPEGFYYQGKVYLMASKLKTPNDAARVLFHEALGHHGLRGLFGKELDQILNQVANMREKEVDAKISEYGLRGVSKLDRRTAAEEVLAEMAQSTPQIGFVRRAVAAIRTWLRTHVPGFKSLALTDAELIRNYILPARAWVENGGTAGNLNGVASFSRDSREAPQTDLEKALVLQGAPVAVLDLNNAPSGGYAAVERWAADLFAQQGGKAISPAFGEVILDARSAKSSVAHGGANDAKKVAFAAVKDVIERGALVYRTTAGNTDSFYSSAPVSISGRDNIVTVLVRRDHNTQRMYLHSVSLKENLLKPRVSSVDAIKASERSGSTTSGEESTLANGVQKGKAATEDVASELNRLLTLDTSSKQDDAREPMFSRSRFMDLKDSALDQLSQTFTHAGKVSLWDKSVGTMRHLGERAPAFKPVYEAASQNIEDVSMLANDAADAAPRLIPRVESLSDMLGKNRKKPVSAADNKAVAKPLFEGTLLWARDENGKPAQVDELQKRHANLSVHNKAAMLLKHGKIDSGVLAMWQGLPLAQFEKLIDSRFESKMLKAGIVWSDSELQSMFGANANQISLYREARAAIDRSIDMTARTDMLRVVGEKYEPMRDAVLAQPSVEAAAQLLLDTLEQDAKADPDSRERLAKSMELISQRLGTAVDLQKAGYAPLSRFGRYTVDVVDANGERQYFGMYESQRESNLAKMQLAQEFKGATITTGTMSAEAYKLFAGVTPETLEQFGEMLGLKAEGNEAQDKAFQEFLKLTKNNHSAMKRMIHRQGIAGFSEDVGRVVANFVYSNARAGAMGLNAGKMDTAIGAIPKEQGELKDLAMGLRSYIRDPQEEGQAVRGMLFAQYLGGSVASAVVNMTQPFQITMPWLSQYGGMKKAGTQMARALNDMRRSWMDKSFSYEDDLAKALQAAEDDGTVSPQEVHQLMAQARGASGLRSGDGTRAGDARAQASNLWEKGKVLWGQPFALAEQFNRRSTFIASYRIAKDQGMADPAGFARKAVLETQFVYTKANKPKWARGAVGGTLFTFKTYSVSYLELMQRMWTQGGPEGKRAVGWTVAMLLLMSGAGGLPFMEDAEDLIDGAGQLMGYNLSSKQWRKELMADAVGKELADFMEQGISGLPGAPIDVSGRMGMGNLIPGTGLFMEKQNRMRDLLEIAGPAGDLVARGFSGARKALTGDFGGAALEAAPTAVRNAAKGIDMATSGIYKDTKGYKVMDVTLDEALAKLIGFQPKAVAEDGEASGYKQRTKSFYIQTSSDIKAQWAQAVFDKDDVALQRVRDRLDAWNRNNPEMPIMVKIPDIMRKVRDMGKDRSQRIVDNAPKALRAQMREMAAEASR